MSPATEAVRPDPSAVQRRAADPARSVWVSASAGTGKTKVLTDRVLAMLLAGTAPHRILCLTFTRAAAAEMANRINRSLADWAVADDAGLGRALAALTGAPPDPESMARARGLFARVLDVPGGMKIQTIHAFCESLLGRFPLEAGIAPHFQLLDERSAQEALGEARDRLLRAADAGDDAPLAEALAEVTALVTEDEFGELLGNLATERGRLRRLIGRHDGLDGLAAAIRARLGVADGETAADIVAAACDEDGFDGPALRRAAEALIGGPKTDAARGETLAAWLAADAAGRTQAWADYLTVWFTAAGAPRARLATKAVLDAAPEALDILAGEAARLDAVRERVRAAVTAQSTAALLRLADRLLDEYARYKREHGVLDYDDLILSARNLLEADGGASWVLFKLDGGIDHILIDESQDTNPDQWRVVQALAGEFFAGEGARESARTVFAVGDAKQSIYSFQRADPDAFEHMRRHFRERVAAAEQAWDDVALDISFRSTEAVLSAVDGVFAQPDAADGVVEPGGTLHHAPYRTGQAGLVELWPPVVPAEREETEAWAAPVAAKAADAPDARLAAVIAGRIARWIESEEMLESRGRPVRAGDVMVLVRRRGRFVEELVRALKVRDVPVAGIDRMVLDEQLAVRDLMALGRFLLLPDDDLTLATVLKGPLFGLTEEELFALAHGRGERGLWQVLRARAGERPSFARAEAELSALLASVDFAPPFELFGDVLGRRGARRLLTARLGRDAEDPIDEFLGRALEFERVHAPSMQGFLAWLEQGGVAIKRDLEQATRDEVRVMTVHGSKGLQAPIVFLPDTMQVPGQVPRLLWTGGDDDELLLWPPRRHFTDPVGEVARRAAIVRRDREYRRLLYVAMTRAEDRLYVCGWENSRKPPEGCWYDLVANSMADREEVAFDFDTDAPGLGWAGPGRRIVNAQDAGVETRDERRDLVARPEQLPDWATRPAPPEEIPPRPLAPSRQEDEPAPRSPLGAVRAAAFRRGLIVHRLLQALPELAPEARPGAAARYLARDVHGLDEEQQRTLAAEVLAVLEDTRFAPLFGPASRAEVPIVGRIGDFVVAGQVDRLLVADGEVRIVDYKTNRPPPADAGRVPSVYLRQMAAYRAVLQQVYPGRRVICALLWTDGPSLTELPGPLLDEWSP